MLSILKTNRSGQGLSSGLLLSRFEDHLSPVVRLEKQHKNNLHSSLSTGESQGVSRG